MKVKVFDSTKTTAGMDGFEKDVQRWLDENSGNIRTVISITQSGDHARTVVTIFYE